MKTNLFFKNFCIFGLVLLISIIALSVPSSADEYIIITEPKGNNLDGSVNISVDAQIVFRIYNNNSLKNMSAGSIKLGYKKSLLAELDIKSNDYLENLKDKAQKAKAEIIDSSKDLLGLNTSTPTERTTGDDSEYYVVYKFNESEDYEDYLVDVTGYIGSTPTNNSIKINVKSKYNTIRINNLNNRSLKYHNRYKQKKDILIEDIDEFINLKTELQNKINTLDNPTRKDLDDLPVVEVMASKDKVIESIKTFKEDSDETLIKDQLFKQLDQINSDTVNITVELAGNLNAKKNNLLEAELKAAKETENSKETEFNNLKSTFQSDVFYPMGVVGSLLGLIIGSVIVSRWKKESEYLGLMTSNANITSPITIATIITLVILILIAVIVHQYGDFGMFS